MLNIFLAGLIVSIAAAGGICLYEAARRGESRAPGENGDDTGGYFTFGVILVLLVGGGIYELLQKVNP